jgi:hypothetical protein
MNIHRFPNDRPKHKRLTGPDPRVILSVFAGRALWPHYERTPSLSFLLPLLSFPLPPFVVAWCLVPIAWCLFLSQRRHQIAA